MTTENPGKAGAEGSIPETVANPIDLSALRFEEDWRAGRSPRIEDFLAEVGAEVAPDLLRELLSRELDLLKKDGRAPTIEEYRTRFPGHEREVYEAFAGGRRPGLADTLNWSKEGGDDPPPKAIPGYEILGELGRGGMGIVYKALQISLGRICALKMISDRSMLSPQTSLRFLAEAKILARLQHAHVVQVFNSGEHEGQMFFEMEYVGGGSLAQKLNGSPWPPSRAARLVEAVARAVDEVHSHRIVHRDLKPANILLSSEGTPKVADFGLAKSLDPNEALTLTGAVLGTPAYMAPEQAQGRTEAVGVATDVYALGAILYELTTGRPPFQAESKLDLLDMIKTTEPEAPSRLVPGLPGEIEAICLRCLSKAPADRFETAGDLADELRRFINGESNLGRPAGATQDDARPRGLIYAAIASASLALVASLGVGGFVIYRRAGDDGARSKAEAKPAYPGVPYVVQAGDYPFAIAARLLGDGERWREMRKNGHPLTDEDARNLLPGETLYLPPFTP